jgi:glucoamylase
MPPKQEKLTQAKPRQTKRRLGTSRVACLLALGLALPVGAAPAGHSPGAPGTAPTWSYAGKTGIGGSYEAYAKDGFQDGGSTGPVSRLWFSLAQGAITETMYGLIHEAQLRLLEIGVKGDGFSHLETRDMESRIDYLHKDEQGHPLSLAYRIVNRDPQGRYEIEKRIFADPDRETLFVRVTVRALTAAILPMVLADPQLSGTGADDYAKVDGAELRAWDARTHLVLKADKPFLQRSVGFMGVSDGWTMLAKGSPFLADGPTGTQAQGYATTGDRPGNVALTGVWGKLAPGQEATYDLVLGFGANAAEASAKAEASLRQGYAETLARYNGDGDRIGWEDYVKSLSELPRTAAMAADGGALAYASAMVLKVQEDKTYAGALIASLSAPWGDTVPATKLATGYKAVWPRDFYQCAMALLALGDKQTPLAAFRYLSKVQVSASTPGNKGATGWFLQKTHVDGTIEWVGVQLDQTAMPIMLGWKLWQAGLLNEAELRRVYTTMLKPAADFLVDGGKPGIDWNVKETIRPPRTQQERWEEQEGYSPSTTAAVVTGLIAAADIAAKLGDAPGADRYRKAADAIESKIEATMFTTSSAYATGVGNGRHFLRITQNDNPNDKGPLNPANGRPALTEDAYLDAGFLELVRYGVRRADHAAILDSLPELDDMTLPDPMRVQYSFSFPGEKGTFPGWRRYGNDGYGEDEGTGKNYGEDGVMGQRQRGRIWPIFTGERGHYELARAALKPGGVSEADLENLRRTYVRAMELFANDGLMIPEQVWDGVGAPPLRARYERGEGTNSATPLAWSHAEYLKLLRSLADGAPWDFYAPVAARYARTSP